MRSGGNVFDSIVGSAVEVGLNAMGAKHDLPAMEWHIWGLESGPAIEGYPPTNCADAEGACLAWAHALELDEFTFDTGGSNRVWFLNGGSWHVELMTERPMDADDAAREPSLADAHR